MKEWKGYAENQGEQMHRVVPHIVLLKKLNQMPLKLHSQYHKPFMITFTTWVGLILLIIPRYYNTEHRELRNWIPLFHWLLDTSIINSFILY